MAAPSEVTFRRQRQRCRCRLHFLLKDILLHDGEDVSNQQGLIFSNKALLSGVLSDILLDFIGFLDRLLLSILRYWHGVFSHDRDRRKLAVWRLETNEQGTKGYTESARVLRYCLFKMWIISDEIIVSAPEGGYIPSNMVIIILLFN